MTVPFVLGIAADMHGCGYHRIQQPALWLARSGAALANTVLGYPGIDRLREIKPNAVICQRPRDDNEIKAVEAIRKEFGDTIKIIYEIDDLLTEVPAENVHEAFQPPPDEVEINIAKALSFCDWAVCPTPPLAEWLKNMRPGLKVHVMPNYLPELDSDDLPRIVSPEPGAKPIIGWGGSISHDGDLEIIVKAIEELDVEDAKWIFLGHKPRANYEGKDMEFRHGVPPQQYLPLLCSQGFELLLAPLEDNAFNIAKSNLRLIQAGAAGAAVIASPVGPYVRDNPPVFAYAKDADEFLAKIKEWLALPQKKKIWHRARMRNWARQYGVNNNISNISAAWGVPISRPVEASRRINTNKVVVAGKAETIFLGPKTREKAIFESDLSAARSLALKNGCPLLLGTVGSVMSDMSYNRLVEALKMEGVSAAFPMSNDGACGICFLTPANRPSFMALDTESNATCEKVCSESGLEPRDALLAMGPMTLLSHLALAHLPKPDSSICDWSFLSAITGHKNKFVPSAWAYTPNQGEAKPQHWVESRGLNLFATQSALNPSERINLECNFVRESKAFMIGSSPMDAGTWAETHDPERPDLLPESVKVLRYFEEFDVSEINETWIRFEDERTITRAGVDYWLEKTGNEKNADVVYCDALGPENSHFFRPVTFDRELFFGLDYMTGCCLIRTTCLKRLVTHHLPGRLQLFGVLLELIKTKAKIVHCPHLLYWEKEAPGDEGRMMMLKQVFPEYAVKPLLPGVIQPVRRLEGSPSVSIIMLTTGKTWMLRQSLATLLRRTKYPGTIEVLVGRAGERRGDPWKLAEVKDPRVTLIEMGEEKFNWSRENNKLAKRATGDYFVFLNDDVMTTEDNWLTQMIAHAQRDEVGFVGLRLLVPSNGSVQHVGVYVQDGIAGHICKNMPNDNPGYWGYNRLTHESTAVTGANIAINRKKFEQISGFREELAVNYSDVVACLDALNAGYKNICVCTTDMMHAESSSRPHALTDEWSEQIGREGKLLAQIYKDFVDPYWNPSLKVVTNPNKWSIGGLNYEILDWGQEWAGSGLILNGIDADAIIGMARRGIKPILALAEKGRLIFSRPGLLNAPAIEIGERSLICEIFAALGLKEIYEAEGGAPETSILTQCLEANLAKKAA